MAALPAIAMVATIAASGLQAMGQLQQGRASQAALNYEAGMRDKKAAEERAASQREAIEKRQEAGLAMSRQKALAASSGAGVVNPSILDIYSDTAGEGEYNAQVSLYGGESRARGELDQAALARAKGKAARKGSILEAGGTMLGGIGKAAGGSNFG
jgi:hypothetical protein